MSNTRHNSPPPEYSKVSAEDARKKLNQFARNIMADNGFLSKLENKLRTMPSYIKFNDLYANYYTDICNKYTTTPTNAIGPTCKERTKNFIKSFVTKTQKEYLEIIKSSSELMKDYKMEEVMRKYNLENLENLVSWWNRNEFYEFGEPQYINLFRHINFIVQISLDYIDTIDTLPDNKDAQMVSYANQLTTHFSKSNTRIKPADKDTFKDLKSLLSTKLKAKEPRQSMTKKRNTNTAHVQETKPEEGKKGHGLKFWKGWTKRAKRT